MTFSATPGLLSHLLETADASAKVDILHLKLAMAACGLNEIARHKPTPRQLRALRQHYRDIGDALDALQHNIEHLVLPDEDDDEGLDDTRLPKSLRAI